MKCSLVDVKEMKKNKRVFIVFRGDDNIKIIKWNNSSVNTIQKNVYSVQPIRSGNRWVKRTARKKIQQPSLLLHIIE